mgnify:CR=1 FL=1
MYRDTIEILKEHLSGLESSHKNNNPSDLFMEGMYYGGEGEVSRLIDIFEALDKGLIDDMAKKEESE